MLNTYQIKNKWFKVSLLSFNYKKKRVFNLEQKM